VHSFYRCLKYTCKDEVTQTFAGGSYVDFFGSQGVEKISLPNEKKKERKDVTMRKLCFVLMVLLFTAPSFAGVAINCAQVGDTNVVEVSYVASDDANRPRAFGLDITLDSGMLIGDIVSGTESEDYWVYPGTIVIESGSITDAGTPMAPGDDPGALGGSGTSGMTIEMGSLYNDPCDPEHNTPPALTGVLFRFSIKGSGTCTVTIAGNSARGNVVLEDTEPAGDVTYGTCPFEFVSECYSGMADYSMWDAVGKPTCWCFPRQCRGDADGLFEGKGSFWVYGADLSVLLAGWSKTAGALAGSEACADFDHAFEGKGSFQIYGADLTILLANWGTNAVAGDCTPGNVDPSSP